MNFNKLILIRGSGDIASAVAHKLFSEGCTVLIHDDPLPTATRRKMAFTDAIFENEVSLNDILGKRVDDLALLANYLSAHQIIPITVKDFDLVLQFVKPEILIDARMKKHAQPETQISLAKLTIGLGPNFVALKTVHKVIETSWGDSMGKVILEGGSLPLQGEPQTIAGHARDRYVYAPKEGIFLTDHQIGDFVKEGQIIARINETSLLSPITGVIRGLTHNQIPVKLKTKVIEVDPRLDEAQISGIPKRPARIAEGVWEAIQ